LSLTKSKRRRIALSTSLLSLIFSHSGQGATFHPLDFSACRQRAIQGFEELDVALAEQSMPLNFQS
jgi:hypothetical protein